jgi:hydroxylamine reductase
MFCYQCEQTYRSDEGIGCAGAKGMCGKDAATADLQDVLIHVCVGIGQYLHRARLLRATDTEADRFIHFAFFTTLTNVNFNAAKFVELSSRPSMFETASRRFTNRRLGTWARNRRRSMEPLPSFLQGT